jgi:hypothetical protein
MGGRTPGLIGTNTHAPGLGSRPPVSAAASAPFGLGDPGELFLKLKQGARWADVHPVAVRLFGAQSFSLGVVYGMGEQIVNDVTGLAELCKTFLLADLYDLSRRRSGWSGVASTGLSILTGPLGAARTLTASTAAVFFEDELREAAQRRSDLIEAVGYAITHPGEVLQNIKQEYVDKWRAFQRYMSEPTLSNQFAAGKIFGQVLLEVLALFATGVGLAKLVARIPRLAKAAEQLARIAKSLPRNVVKRVEQGGAVTTGTRTSGGGAVTPSQLIKERPPAKASGKTATQSPAKPATATETKAPAKSTLDQQLDDMYAKAPAAKAEIDALADGIAKETGGRVAKAPLKGRARAMEKALEYQAQGGDATYVKDLARNTIVVEQSQYDKAVAMLKAQGAKVKTIDATKDPLGYSGTNSVVKTKAGISAEIQVNTPEMIFAKEKPDIAKAILGEEKYAELAEKAGVPGGRGHELYEQYRVLQPNDPRAGTIAAESRAYYDQVRQAGGH